jgi:hypothetical protein
MDVYAVIRNTAGSKTILRIFGNLEDAYETSCRMNELDESGTRPYHVETHHVFNTTETQCT